MTDSNSPFDADAWLAKDRDYAARAAAVREQNKTALFDALTRVGITTITVEFDGYGDSGQIESIEVKAGDAAAVLPADQIVIARASWGTTDIDRLTESVCEAVETLVYDLLTETHAGWENNDGAYGTFHFDTANRTITLEYNERHMESDYSQHQL